MTVTSEVPAGFREVIVRDKEGPLPIDAEVVADLSWSYQDAQERGHQRWTDITMYRVVNADFTYAIQVTGRSVLYHRTSGRCGHGVNMTVSRLLRNEARYDALVACRNCKPKDLDDLNDQDMVSVEEPIFQLYRCTDADHVVQTMQQRGENGQMSGLSMKLLQAAANVDDAIERAIIDSRRK